MFEYDAAVLLEWITFAIRWLHVITAVAWIGSSFYFIALDLGLRQRAGLPEGAYGEEWQVHGGGFYHVQKYLVAPQNMPDHLTWFKWESYATWLSGFTLLCLVYYVGADLYLVDPNVMALSNWEGIGLSLASIGVGWVVYNILCKSPLGDNPNLLMGVLVIFLLAMSYGYSEIFTGRAALLHLGAFTATIMSANVFFIIIPNQKIVVEDLKAGRTPDAKYGKIAKLRSTHNNYLTLPVLFLMLSNHYPLAFASEYNWLIAVLVFGMGVSIRHFFNSMHARKGEPYWAWVITAVIFVLIMWISTAPMRGQSDGDMSSSATPLSLSPAILARMESPHFEAVVETVQGRCSMCHAQEPGWEGILWAPKGVKLEEAGDIAKYAREIYLQAGLTHAMPPANVSYMEESERQLIQTWYKEVR